MTEIIISILNAMHFKIDKLFLVISIAQLQAKEYLGCYQAGKLNMIE